MINLYNNVCMYFFCFLNQTLLGVFEMVRLFHLHIDEGLFSFPNFLVPVG